MLDFLKTIFGADISAVECEYPKTAPYYIRDGYDLKSLFWGRNQCILLIPTFPSWRLPTVKRQLMKFQENCTVPCALCLENLTSLQRRNLLENNIPFISISQQVYLPFWGCLFTERFKAQAPVTEKMAPGTQLVFLYLYYLEESSNINLTRLSKSLHLSKATCTRAVDDLARSGLITEKTEGTNKWIAPAFEKSEFLKKGYPRLKSPVKRLIFVKQAVNVRLQLKSGMLALADISLVGTDDYDGAVAVSSKAAAEIPIKDTLSQQEFRDFGGSVIEVWGYDPALLAHSGRVDDISLLLSLENMNDERVQMGLDEIRERHKLPYKYEE